MEALTWIIEHRRVLLELAGALWIVISLAVRLTPTRRDDALLARLRRLVERISFLSPRGFRTVFSMPGRDPRKTEARREERIGLEWWVALLGIVTAVTGQACGGSGLQPARTTAASLAVGVTVADPIIDARADQVVEQHQAGEISTDELEEKVTRLERAVRAISSLSRALQAFDLAIDAVDDAQACGTWRAAVDSVVAAAHEVVAALEAAEIDVPSLVTPAIAIAGTLIDAEGCDAAAARAALEIGAVYL